MTDDRDITDDVMEQWREICEESHAQIEKECEDLEMTDEEMAEEYANQKEIERKNLECIVVVNYEVSRSFKDGAE